MHGDPPPAVEEKAQRRRWFAIVAIVTPLAAITAYAASTARTPTARCSEGMSPSGPRCCVAGEHEREGVCVGTATACPPGFGRTNGGRCTLEHARIRIDGGSVLIGPTDWESQGVVSARTIEVAGFWMDRGEVTHQRWQACVDAGACPSRPTKEPGLPVTNVGEGEARAYCHFAGGRLPSADEWTFAAATSEGFRYPWGHTGLVCRRAAYGLERGPCAEGAAGPELAGSRPAGISRSGLLDLAGNVAELATRRDGRAVAMGGSFRSSVAAQLKSWAAVDFVSPSADVGLRCAYDVSAPE